MSKRIVVLALGGNAILPARGAATVERQYRNVDATARQIADLIKHRYKVVITHGNGPQAGSLLIQQEQAQRLVPGQPLDICDAMTQGQIGYMLQNRLAFHLHAMCQRDIPVCTIITQVEVAADDPAFRRPTKPIGPFYTRDEAQRLQREHRAHLFKEVDPHHPRGWRRVVASPRPLAVVESSSLLQLLDNHVVVVTCGGGGVPVVREADGNLRGVEAVIDKDWAACLLAKVVDADFLMILTDVEKVAINWKMKNERLLDHLTVSQARAYHQRGHFPEGSMGPKVLASAQFVENGGEAAVITSLRKARAALDGKTGTWIVPDPRTRPAGR